jgi:predicted membrane chloride channel (bestrophin family)
MSVVGAVVVLATATALAPARMPLRLKTAAYTASLPSPVGEIYADAPSGLFGARPDAYLALEIPVVDETATTKKEELRDHITADDEEPEGSSFGLDLEMRRPGGFAPVVDASGKTQSKDWLHCLSTWPQSYVLRRIANPLASIVVWSSLVAAWYAVFNPVAKPLGTGMHTLVGGALSLLLVFRTNTAYNRFWDGRSIFGSVATAARDVVEFAGLYRREIGVQRADRISSLLKAFPIALQLHLQGFRFSPTSGGAPCEAEAKDAACVGEKEVLRLFRRMGGKDSGEVIARDDFVRSLRKSPEVAAALGVPTDLKAEEALDQLHRLKFDSPRDPEAGVGLRELAAYYAPLDLWRALRRAGAETRDAVARSSNMPLAITTSIAKEIKSVSYAPDDSFTVRERLYLLKRVADLRSTIARAERIVQTPVPLHYARHTSRSVWKSTSDSGAPDNSSLSHFSAMARPCWLRRAVRNRHRHAVEQASRRWRGGRRDDSARTLILISTQVALPLGLVLHAAAVPSTNGTRGGAPGRRRPRVVGVARAPRDWIADREPVPAVAPADAVHGRARPRDRRDAGAAPVTVAHHHSPRSPPEKDQEKRKSLAAAHMAGSPTVSL